ncbi:MAG: hypothetical protein ACI9OH_003060 [Oleispira sp.]|jgi:uncharacterized protein YijF (DUF1287 family)
MIFKKLLLIGLILSSQYSFSQGFELDIVQAALERTNHNVRYDGRYISIPYPNGDVPANIGVCTDVIVRTYRAIGTDLQQLVHEDMVANFEAYPSKRIWGLSRTDKNIDHRRVPNLQAFLSRHGEVLAVSNDASDYKAGNIVTWMLPGNLPHIGLITNKISALTGNPMVVHNIGAGPKLDDVLFSYSITGHYRYIPAKYSDPRR